MRGKRQSCHAAKLRILSELYTKGTVYLIRAQMLAWGTRLYFNGATRAVSIFTHQARPTPLKDFGRALFCYAVPQGCF